MSLINQIPFPAGFETREIETNGATIHVRVGGHHGPAVVLLHGFGNTGDMWAPLAAASPRITPSSYLIFGGSGSPPSHRSGTTRKLKLAI
jgi:pimeloyl-ACP methyl ester carboxylesterase